MCRNQVFFNFLVITQDLSKIKKNPEHPFEDVVTKETCAKVQLKRLNSRVVGARQKFQFFRQNTWFLENNRALPTVLSGIFHYLTSSIK